MQKDNNNSETMESASYFCLSIKLIFIIMQSRTTDKSKFFEHTKEKIPIKTYDYFSIWKVGNMSSILKLKHFLLIFA